MKNERPKQTYRIGEVSRLFDIGADSLRYYERLGIVVPHRASNGYRVYELKDLYKLSIIKDLRGLGFSMKQIGTYLHDQNVQKTKAMLDEERRIIDRELERLEGRKRALLHRMDAIDTARCVSVESIAVEARPQRRCVEADAHLELDEEMDYVIQALHRVSADVMPHLMTVEIGAVLSLPEIAAGATNVYDGVFFVVDEAREDGTFVLPAGQYLTTRYRGPYEQNGRILIDLIAYAERNGLDLCGKPLEFYEIDNRDTADETEFVTRIEIQVST